MGHRKERIASCIRLSLYNYFYFKTNKEFEDFIKKSKSLEKWEIEGVLKHFHKEVYTVDKKIIKWMLSLGLEINVNFHSNLKKWNKIKK